MRAVVYGGREYRYPEIVSGILSQIHAVRPFSCLIEGDARGVDRMAGEWAKRRPDIDHLVFPVTREMYDVYGRYLAPLMRNQQMIDLGNPDVGIQFPGGRGTADMTRRLELAGIEIIPALAWRP